MPLPSPKKGQPRKQFLESCLASPTMRTEFPEIFERFAVCNSRYNRASKREGELTDEEAAELEVPSREELKKMAERGEKKRQSAKKSVTKLSVPDGMADDVPEDTSDIPELDDGEDQGSDEDLELVKGPASTQADEDHFVATYRLCKAEEHPDYTFVLGPVLVPEIEDHQGDIISADEIKKSAHNYMADSQRPGLMHQLMLGKRDVQVVESFIVRGAALRFGKRKIPVGTWMAGMRVYSDKLRKMIREGRLKGFSIGGHTARAVMEDVEEAA